MRIRWFDRPLSNDNFSGIAVTVDAQVKRRVVLRSREKLARRLPNRVVAAATAHTCISGVEKK
jgi:hypothetical protein